MVKVAPVVIMTRTKYFFEISIKNVTLLLSNSLETDIAKTFQNILISLIEI